MISAAKSKTLFVARRHHLVLLHQTKLSVMDYLTLMLMMIYGRTLDWMMTMMVLLHNG
jgi:hypothetical protein